MPRLSRRTLLTALALPLSASVAGCLGKPWNALPSAELTIATGNRGGVFDRYGEALSTVLNRRLTGVSARTRQTNASVQNVRLVAHGVRPSQPVCVPAGSAGSPGRPRASRRS